MNLKTFSFIMGCLILYLAMCLICMIFSCIVIYVCFDKIIYEAIILYGLMLGSIWLLLNVRDILNTFEEAWNKR